MKKRIFLGLALVLLLSFSAVSFAGIACSECNRGSIYTSTTSATCISDGERAYKCTDCSFKSVISILRATGHNKQDAWCHESAYCTKCGTYMGKGDDHWMITILRNGVEIEICYYEK